MIAQLGEQQAVKGAGGEAAEGEESFGCVHCSTPCSSLFITYATIENTSLLQCATCGNDLDVYQTHTYPLLLLDLLLLKPRVYRHLLFNRGAGNAEERAAERMKSAWRVGGVVMGLDAYIRCASTKSSNPFPLFARMAGYCLLETLSLHLCIALSALLFSLFSKQRLPSLSLLPLTLFYTSLPPLFLLSISSIIWRAEYAATPPLSHTTPLLSALSRLPLSSEADVPFAKVIARIASLSRENLRSGVSRVGNVSGWASDAVVRKGVGGSSAVVGVSVLLGASKVKTVGVLVVAWCLHLGVLHAIDPWITWLARVLPPAPTFLLIRS